MFDANTSLCYPKFSVGDKVESKYKDEYEQFNGEGVIEEVIVLVRYKIRFKGGKCGKFPEEDLKKV